MKKKEKEKDFGDELYDLMKKHNIPMESAEDMINDVVKSIAKPVKKALKAELDGDLGHEKNKVASKLNYQNNYSKKNQNSINQIEKKVIFMYSKGYTNRDISSTIREIYGFSLNASYISKITDKILPEIKEFQTRKLDKIYPMVFIDEIKFKTREKGYSLRVLFYVLTGINMNGMKEVLGYYTAESRTSKYWLKAFNDLKARGVEKILIIATHILPEISESISKVFPESNIRRSIHNQIKIIAKNVTNEDHKEFCNDLKKMYKVKKIEKLFHSLKLFEQKWNSKYTYAVGTWRRHFWEVINFFQYPKEVKTFVYNANPIENLNKTIKKYSKYKSGFPDKKSLNKSLFLSIKQTMKKWNKPIRNWEMTLKQLSITFDLDI